MADIPVSQLTLLHAQPIGQAERKIAEDWIATYRRYLGDPQASWPEQDTMKSPDALQKGREIAARQSFPMRRTGEEDGGDCAAARCSP